MASINQLVSEIAHSVQGADNIPTRRGIKLAIIHARNKLIRHSYETHGYIDRVIQQRYRVALIDVGDGDIDYASAGISDKDYKSKRVVKIIPDDDKIEPVSYVVPKGKHLFFNNGDKIISLPCVHIYHGDCIKKWFLENNFCPICKYVFNEEDFNN